jgi:hypothetical protein
MVTFIEWTSYLLSFLFPRKVVNASIQRINSETNAKEYRISFLFLFFKIGDLLKEN